MWRANLDMMRLAMKIEELEQFVLVVGQSEAWFDFGDIIPAAALLLIIMSLMMRSKKSKRDAALSKTSGQEMLEKNRQLHGVRADLDDLMVEIQQMARRLGSQLDNKTLHLERLLGEADEKIAHLERLKAGEGVREREAIVDGDGFVGGEGGPSEGNEEAKAIGEHDPIAKQVYELAGQGLSATEIAWQLNEHVGKVELILALAK